MIFVDMNSMSPSCLVGSWVFMTLPTSYPLQGPRNLVNVQELDLAQCSPSICLQCNNLKKLYNYIQSTNIFDMIIKTMIIDCQAYCPKFQLLHIGHFFVLVWPLVWELSILRKFGSQKFKNTYAKFKLIIYNLYS